MTKKIGIKENEMRVRLMFTEEVLGTLPSDKDIYTKYIAPKAPDEATRDKEVAEFGTDVAEGANGTVDRGKTVFDRVNNIPCLRDYQIKGFFKDACGMLSRVSTKDTASAGLRAYKKSIDGLIFIKERKIPFLVNGSPFTGETGECQRPLRAQTPQGERVSIAISEVIPAGTSVEFTIICLSPDLMPLIREWLDYGALRGLSQWRNSGKGTFTWEKIDEDGKAIESKEAS